MGSRDKSTDGAVVGNGDSVNVERVVDLVSSGHASPVDKSKGKYQNLDNVRARRPIPPCACGQHIRYSIVNPLKTD